MKKLKIFSGALLSLLILAAIPVSVNACGYEPTNYYEAVFTAVNTPQYDEETANYNETIGFWKNYTQGKLSEKAIRQFFDSDKYDMYLHLQMGGEFTEWLANHNGGKALEYLDDCVEFQSLNQQYYDSGWEYSERDKADLLTFLDKIKKRKSDKTFQPRYAMLQMRVAATLQDDKLLLGIWEKTGKKVADGPLRRRMGGLVGGAYYRQGDYIKAMDYFLEAGDNQSLLWCVQKLAGVSNLRALTAKHLNSRATLCVLQDYVNFLIDDTRAGAVSSLSLDNQWTKWNGISVYDAASQTADFIKLCDEVLATGNVESPLIWQTARGIVECVSGDYRKAKQTIREASGLKGDKVAQDNYARMSVWVYMKNAGRGNEADDKTFIAACDQLAKKAEAQARQIEAIGRTPSYDWWDEIEGTEDYDFFTGFLAVETVNHFTSIGKKNMALAVMAMTDALPVEAGWTRKLRDSLFREVGLSDAKAFITFIDSKCYAGALEKWLHPYAKSVSNMAFDALGTRLMRECRFEEALPWLDRIETKWCPSSATYPYLSRYYGCPTPKYYEFRRKQTGCGQWSPWRPVNYKARYCRQVIELNKEYKNASREQSAQAALDLAAALHYGSPLGDGWALTDFAWSCMSLYSPTVAKAAVLIEEARYAANDLNTVALANFALLAMPTWETTEWGKDPVWAIDSYRVPEGNRAVFYYWDRPHEAHLKAMQTLMRNWTAIQSEFAYAPITCCDVLRDYAAGRFIVKPQ